jgi:hypothetical protein
MKNTPGLLQSCPLLHVEGARLHLLQEIPDGYCLSYRLKDQFALEKRGGGGEVALDLHIVGTVLMSHESVSFFITKAMGPYVTKFIPVRYPVR